PPPLLQLYTLSLHDALPISAGFVVRYTTDLLNGVPSIVMGIFTYALIVLPMKHFSTFAGGAALGIMMIPIAVRSTEEFLRAVPKDRKSTRLNSSHVSISYAV